MRSQIKRPYGGTGDGLLAVPNFPLQEIQYPAIHEKRIEIIRPLNPCFSLFQGVGNIYAKTKLPYKISGTLTFPSTYKRATFMIFPYIFPDKQGFCLPPSYRLWQSPRRARPFKKTPVTRCLFYGVLGFMRPSKPACFIHSVLAYF